MRCSPLIALSFIACSVLYGSSAAVVKMALVRFTAEIIIVFRMLFGCGFCTIVLVFRMIFSPGYRSIVRAHFASGFWPVFNLCMGGLINLGIPHSLQSISQQWVPSAAVQLAKPLSPAISQVFAHFFLTDEPFTWLKFGALVSALVGVALTAVPSFLHTSTETSATKIAIGYVLLLLSTVFFGFATVYFKWKTPNTDITVSSMIQTGFSFIFCTIWSLIMEGPEKIKKSCTTATWVDWMWPLILGVGASGISVHGFMYLVNTIGAVGANFVPFGQILVGVSLGVALFKEWAAYSLWEIIISVVGILLLSLAIVLGFIKDKKEKPPEEIEEEESEAEEEDKNVILDEI